MLYKPSCSIMPLSLITVLVWRLLVHELLLYAQPTLFYWSGFDFTVTGFLMVLGVRNGTKEDAPQWLWGWCATMCWYPQSPLHSLLSHLSQGPRISFHWIQALFFFAVWTFWVYFAYLCLWKLLSKSSFCSEKEITGVGDFQKYIYKIVSSVNGENLLFLSDLDAIYLFFLLELLVVRTSNTIEKK